MGGKVWYFWPLSKATITWCWGHSCLDVWGLTSAMVSSWHSKPHSLERGIKSSEDRVWLPTWQGNWKTAAHAVLSPYGLYFILYMYGRVCTYWVTLRVYSWGILQLWVWVWTMILLQSLHSRQTKKNHMRRGVETLQGMTSPGCKCNINTKFCTKNVLPICGATKGHL